MSKNDSKKMGAQGANASQDVVMNGVMNANYRFDLPLTDEQKGRVIEILNDPTYVFVEGEASFMIKRHDEHKETRTDKGGLQIELSFDEKVEKETQMRKIMLEFAKAGIIDAVTVALGFCWNEKTKFNEVRGFVREYRKDEYEYFREHDAECQLVSDSIARIKYSQNYLKPRVSEKRVPIKIEGVKYTIAEKIFIELKKQYGDDREALKKALLAEAKVANETVEEF